MGRRGRKEVGEEGERRGEGMREEGREEGGMREGGREEEGGIRERSDRRDGEEGTLSLSHSLKVMGC